MEKSLGTETMQWTMTMDNKTRIMFYRMFVVLIALVVFNTILSYYVISGMSGGLFGVYLMVLVNVFVFVYFVVWSMNVIWLMKKRMEKKEKEG